MHTNDEQRLSGHQDAPEAGEEGMIPGLPPPPPGYAGDSLAHGQGFTAKVSNEEGYMASLFVETIWEDVTPHDVFSIFTYPDNSALLRDLKRVGGRKVLKTEPGYKEVEVEQFCEVRVLWMTHTFSTWLHVTEDSRNPELICTTFVLKRSDVLSRFNGSWKLYPIKDERTGQVTGCRGVLTQSVLPKGMPTWMTKLPLLGGVLRASSLRVVIRLMEDMNTAVDKIREGHKAGLTTEATLRQLCGTYHEVDAHTGTGTALHSFAFDGGDDDDDTYSSVEEEEQQQHDAAHKAAGEKLQQAPGGEGGHCIKVKVLCGKEAEFEGVLLRLEVVAAGC